MTPRDTVGATYAIVPVKRYRDAKQRLGEALSSGARRALAESMLTDVLTALRRTAAVDEVLLITSEPSADAIGRGYGALVIEDAAQAGQSAATMIGIEHALGAGATRALLLAADCPAMDPAEITALLDRPSIARSVTLVPDRHGTGTNALLLTPPDAIEPSFGPDSRARHEQTAATARIPCAIETLPTLALDIDTGDDLAELRRMLAARRGGAAHTRGILSRLAARDRPPADGA